ncbi:Uncharacterised protein [Fusobacterium necrogenes]|uniref:Uncharacterized protein n=1 Tax=Fusobacterium necrogenes TaxID=858 RepID=A0A377GUP3_9FUSO|nr:hypothetical protein [Fusobacterium necrogenes]STO30666.1 Uncharacterised protein [Fusobacterium necrogenes]
MGSRIKKLLILLIMVLGVVLFASEEKKAPNEIVKDNPEREVTTVESMKVREHATMSLSVTKKNEKVIEGELIGDTLKIKLPIKGINENTLDRMVKTKEGKKLVIESKSRVNPRMARMVTNTTKKMPTQEEMNNLTLEQVKAMMNNSDTKEIEAQSKSVKNHIAVENESGIDVEVLDVNRNEDIYVNVEENDEVIDRYRVMILPRNSTARAFTLPSSPIEYTYLNSRIIQIGGNKVWLGDKNRTFGANINNLDTVEFKNQLSGFILDDDFIDYSIGFNFTNAVMGTSIRLKSTLGDGFAPLFTSSVKGSKGEVYDYFITEPTKGLYYSEYNGNGKLFEGRWKSNPKEGAVNAFRYIDFLEKNTTNNVSTSYLANATATGIGFELDIPLKSTINQPGRYITEGFITTTISAKDQQSSTIKAHYIYMDMGDQSGDTFAVKIPNDKIKKSQTTLNKIDTGNWMQLNAGNTNLSFMKSNDNTSSFNNIGLFINGEVNRQIARYSAGKDSNVHTITYNQGNKVQTFKIRVSQQKGSYAQVEILPITLQNPDNTAETPQVKFYIVQGRKDNQALREYRKVEYTVNFPRIQNLQEAGNISMELDPRLQQILGNNKFIGTGAQVVDENLTGNKSYTNMLKLTNSIKSGFEGKQVIGIESIEGKNLISGGLSNYNFFGSNSIKEIGLKKSGTQIGWYGGGNNDLLVSSSGSQSYKVRLNGESGERYSLNVNVNYVSGIDKTGYSGSGLVNISKAEKNVPYIFEPPTNGNSTTTSGMIMTISGAFPNIKGVVTGKTGVNIADNVEVSVRGSTTSGIKVETDNQTIGDKIYTVDGHLKVGITKEGKIKIIKLTSNFDYTSNDTTDNIILKYKYGDIILGTFTLKIKSDEVDGGDITFKIDPRLEQISSSIGNYITGAKTLGSKDFNNHNKNFSELIEVTTNYLNDAATARDVYIDSIQNKKEITNGINQLYIGFGENQDEEPEIILKRNPENLNYYSGNTRDTLISILNPETYRTKIRDQNDKIYNVDFIMSKSDQVVKTGYTGAGKLNLARAEIDYEYIFEAGRNTSVTVPTSGKKDRNVILNITSGKSLDATGVLSTNNDQSIANRMEIKEGDNLLGTITGTAGDKLEVALSEYGVKIGITQSGQLIVAKVEDINIATKVLTINYYYDINNVSINLGTFTLTLENYIIGDYSNSVSIEIDKRFTKIDTYNWLLKNGTKSSTITDTTGDKFLDFFEFKGELNTASLNGNIEFGLSVEERPDSFRSENNYDVFLTGTDIWENESAIPVNIDISRLNENLIVSKFNGNNPKLDNKFSLVFDDSGIEKIYKGKIVESILGGELRSGSGILDVSKMKKNIEYKFKTEVENGEIVSSNDSKVLIKEASGTVNTKGIVTGKTTKNVANKIKVTFDDNTSSISANSSMEIENKGLKVAINTNGTDIGGLILTKIADEIPTDTVKIEYFYTTHPNSNELTVDKTSNRAVIKLGEFNLNLINNKAISMGEIEVKIDKRLAQIPNAEWVGANGILRDNSGIYGNYSELVSATDNIDANLDVNKVVSVKAINGEENLKNAVGMEASYKYMAEGNNIIALPYSTDDKTVTLGDYDVDTESLIFVSKRDISIVTKNTSNQEISNNFILETSTSSSDTLYSGIVKETYIGKKDYSGSGNIDLETSEIGKKYIFETTESQGIVSGNNGINITQVSGDPVNSLDVFGNNKNIANKLKVEFIITGNTRQIRTTTTQTNALEVTEHNLSIGIDTKTGGLTLTRNGGSDVTQAIITYYYDPGEGDNVSDKAVTLGMFTLNIANANPVIPLGTLKTTIDPRLGKITDEEWLTLGSYGGRDLLTLTENKYLGLIETKQGSLTPSKTIHEISKVMKGSVNYDPLDEGNSNSVVYKKYGKNSIPKVAILKSKTDDNIIDTSELATGKSLARKINDIDGDIYIEFKASDNSNNSFFHSLEVKNSPSEKPDKFTADNGYIGSGSVDLSGKDLNTSYTLVESNATDNEINMESIDGWLPTFTGIVSGYTNQNIVSYYTVKINNGTANKVEFTGDGYDYTDFKIKLSQENTKNIIITKKNDNTYDTLVTVLIEYYHSSGIKLGEFTLNISNTRTEKDLGTATVKLDARISQVDDNYSWINLKNGDMFRMEAQNGIGNYRDFIEAPSTFSNAEDNSMYNNFNLEKVLEINGLKEGSSNFVEGFYTFNNVRYTTIKGENEAGIPTGIDLESFLKVDATSKLVISKWDVRSSKHNKNNEFLISARNGNQVVAFKGNIKEKYLNQTRDEIDGVISKDDTIFKGSGSLNLIEAELERKYSFAVGQNGTVNGNGGSNVVLKINEGKSLDATGVLASNDNNSIANRMVIKDGDSVLTTIDGTLGNELTSEELTIESAKVKIGIDGSGQLTVTKTQDGNISSKVLVIDYYYVNKINTNAKNDIHLGSFKLTLMNPIIESSTTPTVIIDKRFAENEHYNWLFRNGRASDDLYQYPENAQDYSKLFKYSTQNLNNLPTNAEICDAIGMEGRIHRENSSDTDSYRLYHINDAEWHGEAAVPIVGSMNNLNNIVTISKGNSEDSISKENKFSLLFEEDGEMKIYKGNIKENITGDGVSNGSGEVTFISTDTDITYEFPTTLNNQETNVIGNGTDNRTLAMKNVKTSTGAIQALPNGNGLTEIVGENQVIANKITVSCKDTNSSNAKEVTIDNITFGIGDNGGLTLKKGKDFNPSEDKVYTIKFYYKNPGNDSQGDIELSTFDLTIRDSIFEIDGDGVLNFGDMVYNSNYPYVTQGGIFYVKCNDPAMIEGKKVEFSVEKDKVQSMKNTNGQTGDQNEVPLVNTQVQTRSNGKFYLQSTADLSKKPNTGKYEGEIEVTVTITSP